MTSPALLVRAAGLELGDCVPWGTPPSSRVPGIYIVSTAEDPAEAVGWAGAPVSTERTAAWLAACPRMSLAGSSPTPETLAAHLARWWLPVSVLYIGLTTQPLRSRVVQYYKTPLGAEKPHAGGNWIQTLAPNVLDACWVHLAELVDGEPSAVKERVEEAEEAALGSFLADGERVRPPGHPEPDLPLPFANLQIIRKGSKSTRQHAITWRQA